MRPRAALLIPLLLIAGCGGGDEKPAATPAVTETASPASTAEPSRADGQVAIKDFEYAPERLTVAAGTKVTWENEDASNHTASGKRNRATKMTRPSGRCASTTQSPMNDSIPCRGKEGAMPDPALHEIASLDEVDPDGVVREGAEALGGDTPVVFFRRAACSPAPAWLGGAGGLRVPRAAAEGRRRDPQLRADARVPRGGVLRRGPVEGPFDDVAARVRADRRRARERARDALQGALGPRPSRSRASTSRHARARRRSWRPPRCSRTPASPPIRARRPKSRRTEVLASAGSILAVEARHAAWVRDISARARRRPPRPRRSARRCPCSRCSTPSKTGFIKC